MKILTYFAAHFVSLAAILVCLGCGMGLSTWEQTLPASTHQVNLSWTASTSSNIYGYNVWWAKILWRIKRVDNSPVGALPPANFRPQAPQRWPGVPPDSNKAKFRFGKAGTGSRR